MRHLMLASALLLAGTATPALAGSSSDEISFGSTSRALRGASADALTDNTLDGGELTVARDLHLAPLPGLALWAELGFGWGEATGAMFQTIATDITSYTFTAGLRARYTIYRYVGASVHVETGAARAALSLDDGSGASMSDHAWGATAAAGLAVDAIGVSHTGYGFGVRLAFDYVVTSRIALTPAPAGPSDGTITLPMQTSSIGHLDLHGPSVGLALVGRF